MKFHYKMKYHYFNFRTLIFKKNYLKSLQFISELHNGSNLNDSKLVE